MALKKIAALQYDPLADPLAVDPTQAVTVDPYAPARLPQLSARMVDPINKGIPTPEKPYAPSALAIIDRYFASPDSFGDAKRNLIAQHEQDQFDEANKPQMQAMAQMQMALKAAQLRDIAALPPRERIAALANAAEYGKNLATRYGAHNLAAGNTLTEGDPTDGGSVYTAPRLGEANGVTYTQTPDKLSVTGKLPQVTKPDWKERKKADGSTEWIDVNDPSNISATDPTGAPGIASGPVFDQIASFATKAGAKPEELSYLNRLAQVESSGDPTAKNGLSTGPFQFHPDTFARVGGKDINDIGQQTQAALAMSRQDRQTLQSLGLPPTDANVYIMHQQGPGGGKALLTAPPEINAIAALTPVYGDAATARKAIVNNGGTADMTAGQFVDMWRNKWGAGQGQVTAKAGRAIPGSEAPPPDVNADLTPEAQDMAAMRYAMTGTMPTLGMGKDAVRMKTEIQNRASKIIKDANITAADWVTGMAQFKIAQSSLGQVSKTRNMVEASENAVLKNMDFVLGLAPKAGPGGIPFLNKYAMAAKDKVFGDPDVKAYDNALHTVADEYAKVLTTTTGAGGAALSDSARQEAYRRLSAAQTLPQLQASFAAIKTEMDNRKVALSQQEAGLVGQLRNGLHAPGEVGAEPGAMPGAQPALVKDGKGRLVPAAMHQAMQQFRGSKAPAGSPGNPRTILDDAGFAAVPRGQYYMGPDGQVRGPKP